MSAPDRVCLLVIRSLDDNDFFRSFGSSSRSRFCIYVFQRDVSSLPSCVHMSFLSVRSISVLLISDALGLAVFSLAVLLPPSLRLHEK